MAQNILVVDDSKMFLKLFEQELNDLEIKDLKVHHFTSFKEALSFAKQETVSLIVSDFKFQSGETGIDFLNALKSDDNLKKIPFIFASSDRKMSSMKEAFLNKAEDFFTKPLDPIFFLKIKNIIEDGDRKRQISTKMIALSEGMDEAVEIVKEREREIILRLAKAAATRDKETGNHIYRVGQYSLIIAKALKLPFHMQETIEKASPLHDVGKIAIPDAILQKPGKLTDEEFRVMKNHTIYGYKVLFNPNMELLKVAAEIALSHHERWDGTGYPYGKKAEEIPLAARITSVADVFDAFTSRRRYKSAWSLDESFQSLEDEAGSAFDEEVVKTFLRVKDQVIDVHNRLKDDD